MSGGASPEQEREMVAQLQQGDAGAIESLYDRYSSLAYGLAYRILNDRAGAEDVVQDAFLALWRNARAFDAGRGSLRAWLLSIVRNRAIDRLRGPARAREAAPLEKADRERDVTDAWEEVALDLERRQVREAFGRLPEAQRQTLQLAFFAGYTHVEIARLMNVPLGTVKGRMRIGLEKMRAFLQARGVEA